MADLMGSAWDFMDKDKFKQLINENGVPALKSLCDKIHNDWKSMALNVAVTGNSGTGKSSFINAIRGLDAEDDCAAKVDEVEGTNNVRQYPHPSNSSLQFWDLPGVGTPRFTQATYLDAVDFDRYDFFLILSRDRFTENDMWLAKQIHARQKMFFFVRTKIDHAVNDDKLAHWKAHDEAVLLNRIKQDCIKKLSSAVIGLIPDVFLISSHHQYKFDFRRLADRLIEDFPALKREALVLSLSMPTAKIIREKADVLRKRVWSTAALSAAIGVIPIPGIAASVDMIIITKETLSYQKQFGLDDKSLAVLCRDANMSVDDIRSKFSGIFMCFSADFIVKGLGTVAISKVAENTALIIFPIVGSLIAAGISYQVTSSFLWKIIDKLEAGSLKINSFLIERIAQSVDDQDMKVAKL